MLGISRGMGPLEAQIVRAVSGLPRPVTVRQVCDALARDGYFAYQGVLNCMNRLVEKRILARAKRGNVCYYRPLIELDELVAQVVSSVLGHLGGELDRVVCRVLEIDPDVGAKRIAGLRRRVRAMGRGKQG
jgi:predicted transcriptional regulator